MEEPLWIRPNSLYHGWSQVHDWVNDYLSEMNGSNTAQLIGSGQWGYGSTIERRGTGPAIQVRDYITSCTKNIYESSYNVACLMVAWAPLPLVEIWPAAKLSQASDQNNYRNEERLTCFSWETGGASTGYICMRNNDTRPWLYKEGNSFRQPQRQGFESPRPEEWDHLW